MTDDATGAMIPSVAIRQAQRHLAEAARLLSGFDGDSSVETSCAPSPSITLDGDQDLARLARHLIWERSLRRNLVEDPNLFGEPAWDLLLDLFAAQVEGLTIGVSSACIAANAPTTTGLRYIAKMASSGIVDRTASARDDRCVNVTLSWSMMAQMRSYLRRVADARSMRS